MVELKANTAVDVLIGPFVDSTDGDTEETGLTIEDEHVLLSKNGQALTAKNDDTTCTHDADGYYNCELNATDTNTEGTLTLTVHVAGALAVRHDFNVLSEAAWDSKYAPKDSGYMDVNVKAVSEDTTAADNLELITEISNITSLAVDASGHVEADVVEISGSSTAADNAEIVFDTDFATNYNTTRDAWVTNLQDTVGTGNLTVDVIAISGDTTAANNLESAYDGTGYDVGGIDVSELNSVVDDLLDGGRLDLIFDDTLADTADLQANQGNWLTATGYATAAALATVDANVDAILVDTGTTLPGTLTTIESKIDTVDGIVDDILTDTGTTLEGHLTDIKGGTFSGATDSLEAIRNQGDSAWITATGFSTHDAADVRTEMDANSTQLAAIVADTDELQTNQGDWATAVGFSTHDAADVLNTITDDNTAIDASALNTLSTTNVYHADIDLRIDDANAQDEYTVTWFKNGVPVTTGITNPAIQAWQRTNGSALVNQSMSQIGLTGTYKYDESSNRTTAGEAYILVATATIDGSTRTWYRIGGRDSSA
jgi:hypothetical protein